MLANQGEARELRLAVMGITVDEKASSLLPPLRLTGGVLMAAKVANIQPPLGDPLLAGDIIHSVNGESVQGLASLRSRLESVKNSFPSYCRLKG